MHTFPLIARVCLFTLLGLLGAARVCLAEQPLPAWKETGRLASADATQGAAADDQWVYAISNRFVARHDRQSGKLLARSVGEATHLNGGFFFEGKLYCAHSNYPAKPEKSEIKVLDPQTMQLTTWKDLGASDGSLTWAIHHQGAWWLNFAFYGDDAAKTYLARYDEGREKKRWTYPENIVRAFDKRSASGGIWRDGKLLVTGHDAREIYVLSLPDAGAVLRYVGTAPAPFTGQGFATDPKTGGLIGIDRAARKLVFAQQDRSP